MSAKTILAYSAAIGAVLSPLLVLNNELQDWISQLTALCFSTYLFLPILMGQPSCYTNFWPCLEQLPDYWWQLWALLTN